METLHLRQAEHPVLPLNTPQEETPSIFLPVPVNTALQTRPRTGTLPFIEANTKEVDIRHLRQDCIIPVFSKDNEVTISHQSFIASVYDAAEQVFGKGSVSDPSIRVSHVVKGRIPEAMHKPVKDLLESDKTIYYERMMFAMEIPSIATDIAGNRLNLTVGGVRAYNHENLYSRKTAEKFKLFIGFKNLVCCNLCVSTDGYKACLKAMDTGMLTTSSEELFRSYAMESHIEQMMALQDYSLNESQFAQFIGRCRLYQFLPSEERKAIPALELTDTQITAVAKSYYEDKNFKRGEREISMWKVFNLFTGANKSSYIDNFLDRSVNAGDLASGICAALRGDSRYSWFIS